MAYETIIYEKKEHLAILTLNRPEALNAMNSKMGVERAEATADFVDDPNAWVLIIIGAGDRAFSAGADLKEMAGRARSGTGSVFGTTRRPPSLTAATLDVWKPVIAAINGYCVGGGLELALSCDVRIATESARLGLMEPKRGIWAAGGGPIRLPRVVPFGIAMEILLSADLIDAKRAYEIGLVNQVVPSLSDLMPAAQKMAERFMQSAPLSLQTTKETAYRTYGMPIKEAARTRFGIDPARSEDAREGTTAFAEKRTPEWKGK